MSKTQAYSCVNIAEKSIEPTLVVKCSALLETVMRALLTCARRVCVQRLVSSAYKPMAVLCCTKGIPLTQVCLIIHLCRQKRTGWHSLNNEFCILQSEWKWKQMTEGNQQHSADEVHIINRNVFRSCRCATSSQQLRGIHFTHVPSSHFATGQVSHLPGCASHNLHSTVQGGDNTGKCSVISTGDQVYESLVHSELGPSGRSILKMSISVCHLCLESLSPKACTHTWNPQSSQVSRELRCTIKSKWQYRSI